METLQYAAPQNLWYGILQISRAELQMSVHLLTQTFSKTVWGEKSDGVKVLNKCLSLWHWSCLKTDTKAFEQVE